MLLQSVQGRRCEAWMQPAWASVYLAARALVFRLIQWTFAARNSTDCGRGRENWLPRCTKPSDDTGLRLSEALFVSCICLTKLIRADGRTWPFKSKRGIRAYNHPSGCSSICDTIKSSPVQLRCGASWNTAGCQCSS